MLKSAASRAFRCGALYASTAHDLTRVGGTALQGMDLTTDKLRSLVRKWQTLIEAHVDVKTTDGYFLRMFCIAFTKKRPGQVQRAALCQLQSSSAASLAVIAFSGDRCACLCGMHVLKLLFAGTTAYRLWGGGEISTLSREAAASPCCTVGVEGSCGIGSGEL